MPSRSNIRKTRRIDGDGKFYLDEKITEVILFRMDPRLKDYISYNKQLIKRLVPVTSENKYISMFEQVITAAN